MIGERTFPDRIAASTDTHVAPWLTDRGIPSASSESNYGFWEKGKDIPCSRDYLETHLASEIRRSTLLVQTPELPRLAPVCEFPSLQIIGRRRALRKAFAGLALLVAIVVLVALGSPYPFNPVERTIVTLLLIVLSAELFQAGHFRPEYIAELNLRDRYRFWLRTQQSRKSFALLTAVIGIWILELQFGETSKDRLVHATYAAGYVKSYVIHDGEWWRVVTGAFVHADWVHVAGNALLIYWLGGTVEALTKHRILAFVFSAGVVAGHFCEYFSSHVAAIGASGGIAGLAGFLVLIVYFHHKVLPHRMLLVLFIISVLMVSEGWYGSKVSSMAHLGGFLAGLILGLLLVRRSSRIPVETLAWVSAMERCSLVILAAGAIFAIYRLLTV